MILTTIVFLSFQSASWKKQKLIKSIHLKKTVARISFLSKLWYFLFWFERNEIRATVFFKWTDFSSSPFAFTYKKTFVLSNKNNLKSAEIRLDLGLTRTVWRLFRPLCGCWETSGFYGNSVTFHILVSFTDKRLSPQVEHSFTGCENRIKIKRSKQIYIKQEKKNKQKSWLFWIFVK